MAIDSTWYKYGMRFRSSSFSNKLEGFDTLQPDYPYYPVLIQPLGAPAMSNIAKLVTITPLHKPHVPSSPVYNVPLAPRNVPEDLVDDSLEFMSTLEPPKSDIWSRFSSPGGFFDESGYYFPPIDPPMDPEEMKEFAEKYFSPESGFSSANQAVFFLDDSESTRRDGTLPDFLSAGFDSPQSSEELEQFLLALTSSEWPDVMSALNIDTEVFGEVSAVVESIPENTTTSEMMGPSS
ncbi:hypothetical protein GGU11DRAFT_809790 [Lentinula aff. detonsa]|nr:hypothetical protein GGU11DRAFT_809790 [Lentinula aff. detonsa]